MLNVFLSHKPLSSWRILFWYEGHFSQFNRLEKFRALVVPDGGCRKGVILQGGQLHSGLPVIDHSYLRRKGDVVISSVHATIQRNILYVHMVIWSIYDNRQPKHPRLPMCQYKRRPQGPASCPHYR